MINLMDQTFFMHPLPDHLAQDYGSSTGGQPHLIYRRYLKDVIGKGCDVTGIAEIPSISSILLNSVILNRSMICKILFTLHLTVLSFTLRRCIPIIDQPQGT